MKTILFNPILKYSETQMVGFGIFAAVAGSFLALVFNARFDGLLDLHFTNNVSYVQPFIDNSIAIVCTIIVLFVCGKYINQKTRLIDIVAVTLVARIPFYLMVCINFNNTVYRATQELLGMMTGLETEQMALPDASLLVSLLLITIISLVFIVWFIALLYNGFKVATNAKGVSATVLFAVALLIGEVLSKIIFYFLK